MVSIKKNEGTTLSDMIQILEEVAPSSLQESYDNSGLLIGNPNKQINAALLTLDCTEAVVQEAIDKKCNLIIAHHPIIFKGLKKLNGTNYVERVVIDCVKNDIALYACHTNLDNVLLGVNKMIAQKLGLKKTKILAPQKNNLCKLYTYAPKKFAEKVTNALFHAGAGQIADYDECAFFTDGIGSFRPIKNAKPYIGKKDKRTELNERKIEVIFPTHLKNIILQTLFETHPYEEVAYEIIKLENTHQEIGAGMIGELPKTISINQLLELVSNKLNTKSIKYTPAVGKRLKKIAICGGSGSFLLPHAQAAGADAFISADFKYHEFFDAENRLSILDIGHYESEQYTPQLFYDILSKKLPKFALHLSKVNTNPIKYYSWQK